MTSIYHFTLLSKELQETHRILEVPWLICWYICEAVKTYSLMYVGLPRLPHKSPLSTVILLYSAYFKLNKRTAAVVVVVVVKLVLPYKLGKVWGGKCRIGKNDWFELRFLIVSQQGFLMCEEFFVTTFPIFFFSKFLHHLLFLSLLNTRWSIHLTPYHPQSWLRAKN